MAPATMPAERDFSIIITCLNEERSIDEFSSRLFATIASIDATFEVIFVDDGSRDATFARLEAIYRREPIVAAVLRLFRNSGQAAAITAGISAASGRAIVLIDSDLQLDPENLPRLIEAFRAGNDIVSGYRVGRVDHIRRRLYSAGANFIMRRMFKSPFRDFGCTFKVIDARIVRAFGLGPRNVLRLVDLTAAAGKCGEIPVAHHPRRYGRSGWTLFRLMDLHTDNLMAVMRRPFQYVAGAAAIAGLLLLLRILLDLVHPMKFLANVSTGLLLNATIIALLITTAIQSLIGELVIRSHQHLRSTPAYVVRTIISRTRVATHAEDPAATMRAPC